MSTEIYPAEVRIIMLQRRRIQEQICGAERLEPLTDAARLSVSAFIEEQQTRLKAIEVRLRNGQLKNV